MVDLDKETEDKETVAPSDAEGSANEGSASDEVVSVSPARFRASPLLVFALCLGVPVGFGMGYMNRGSQVDKAKKAADAAGEDHGRGNIPSGPCKVWAETICKQMGELAHECKTAMKASFLLSGSACAQAQGSVLAKIDDLKAKRGPCTELTSKFCNDLGLETKGCELARATEPTFSIERCQNITKNYEHNLAQIMERSENGTLPTPPRAGRPRHVAIAKPN